MAAGMSSEFTWFDTNTTGPSGSGARSSTRTRIPTRARMTRAHGRIQARSVRAVGANMEWTTTPGLRVTVKNEAQKRVQPNQTRRPSDGGGGSR
jgi:hypothetical protein